METMKGIVTAEVELSVKYQLTYIKEVSYMIASGSIALLLYLLTGKMYIVKFKLVVFRVDHCLHMLYIWRVQLKIDWETDNCLWYIFSTHLRRTAHPGYKVVQLYLPDQLLLSREMDKIFNTWPLWPRISSIGNRKKVNPAPELLWPCRNRHFTKTF